MNDLDQFLFDEIIAEYARSNLTQNDYEDLYERFLMIEDFPKVQPYLFAMRYMGWGVKQDEQGVINELRKLSEKKDPILAGLYFDLLLFEKENDIKMLNELNKQVQLGYSDIYLKNNSHLRQNRSYNRAAESDFSQAQHKSAKIDGHSFDNRFSDETRTRNTTTLVSRNKGIPSPPPLPIKQNFRKSISNNSDYASLVQLHNKAESGSVDAMTELGLLLLDLSLNSIKQEYRIRTISHSEDFATVVNKSKRSDPNLDVDTILSAMSDAYRYCEKAAELGNLDAMYITYIILHIYYKDNYSAFKYAKMGADKGVIYLRYIVGSNFASGKVVAQNIYTAEEYLRAPAEKGYYRALYDLGILYQSKGDNIQAIKYFGEAAKKGDLGAQTTLAYKILTSDVNTRVQAGYTSKDAIFWLVCAVMHSKYRNNIRNPKDIFYIFKSVPPILDDTEIRRLIGFANENIPGYIKLINKYMNTVQDEYPNYIQYPIENFVIRVPDVIMRYKKKSEFRFTDKLFDAYVDFRRNKEIQNN